MDNHISLLSEIFALSNVTSVLEIGTGIFSTPFFSNHAKQVVTIEQQNQEWIEKCKEHLTKNNVEFLYLDSRDKLNTFFATCPRFDLFFIDGIDRDYFMESAVTCSDLIVVHDSQAWLTYGISVKVPSDQKWFAWCNGEDPATSMLTTNYPLIEEITKRFHNGSFVGL